MPIEDIARRINVSKRTVYRDLNAIEGEIGIGVWSEDGSWGLADEGFLPPLKLTLDEAMAVVLSARLMVRYADKYDPDLASAFEKLGEVLPAALGEHVARTLDVLSRHPRDERFSRHVRLLTKAWAERRIVSLDYEPARYGPESAPRTARVQPYLIEPSLQTHALYLVGFDETRGAVRTFKVERIRDVSVTPDRFEPPEDGVEAMFNQAWDIIADQEPVEVVIRFAPKVAARVQEARWHPSQTVSVEDDGSLTWRATVAGTIEVRLWALQWGDDAEVLEPASLRGDVAATVRRSAERYEGGG
jgi:predicted DNA-binding transcriptional regulator YafY